MKIFTALFVIALLVGLQLSRNSLLSIEENGQTQLIYFGLLTLSLVFWGFLYTKNKIVRVPVWSLILGFGLMAYGLAMGWSSLIWIHYSSIFLLVFLVAFNSVSENSFRHIAYWFLSGLMLASYMDLMGVTLHHHAVAGISGLFNQKNGQGLASVMTLGYSMYLWKFTPSSKFRALALVVGIFSLLLIFISGSKSAMLASLVLVLWVSIRKLNGQSSSLKATLVLLLIWIIPLYWIWIPNLPGVGTSVWSREAIFSATIQLIREHWLWGVGVGQYSAAIGNYWHSFGQINNMGIPPAAHHLFLHIWAEMGLIGFLLANLIVWLTTYTLVKQQDKEKVNYLVGLLLAVNVMANLDIPVQLQLLPQVLFFGLVSLSMQYSSLKSIEISHKRMLVILILSSLPGIFSWSAYSNQLDAEELVGQIQVSGRVNGIDDVNRIQKALEINPNNATALYYGGTLMLQNNQLATASEIFEALQKNTGDQFPVRKKLALLSLASNKCEAFYSNAWYWILRNEDSNELLIGFEKCRNFRDIE